MICTEHRRSQQHRVRRADRLRRVWALVETLAAETGLTRTTLAARFCVSERQVQDDLAIVAGMGLRLTRRGGYLLVDEHGRAVSGGLTFAHLLALADALADHQDQLTREAAAALTGVAPLHLRPLAHELFAGERRPLFLTLARAILDGRPVRLTLAGGRTLDPLLPQLVLPYRGGWWLVGMAGQQDRVVALTERVEVEPWPALEIAS